MPDMDRVIHTKPNCKNNVDAWDDIDSDVPEVKKADDIGQGDDDNGENHEADGNIGKKYQSDDKNTNHSKSYVSPQFIPDNLICLPGSIHLDMTKSSL